MASFLRFPRQHPLHFNLLPNMRYMACLSKLSRFDCPNMTNTVYKDISSVVICLNFRGNIWETTLIFSNFVVNLVVVVVVVVVVIVIDVVKRLATRK